MSTSTETWLTRALLVASWALFLWLLLRRLVPPHPIEQAPEGLFLAGALTAAMTAHTIASSALRRLLLVTAGALVLATFLSL